MVFKGVCVCVCMGEVASLCVGDWGNKKQKHNSEKTISSWLSAWLTVFST